ncbi:hypothetical protein [Stigmatella aurantiaca]|nr:hypothetical protein [Stigmatella aurantiaca]
MMHFLLHLGMGCAAASACSPDCVASIPSAVGVTSVPEGLSRVE